MTLSSKAADVNAVPPPDSEVGGFAVVARNGGARSGLIGPWQEPATAGDHRKPSPLTHPRQRCSVPAPFVDPESLMSAKPTINLEKSLEELESLVDELESGELPLEVAMKKFEAGIKLTRNCQAALKDAEQRVEILLKSAGGDEALQEFDVEGT
jgi:exodeoxyribonuclease VII small subunit